MASRWKRLPAGLALVALALGPVGLASGLRPADVASALRWRLVGPFRAGWATCAAGVPNEPDTFYFGAAGGGVWKTTDAGQTWAPMFDREGVSAIGALAVAPSNTAVLYAGTGLVSTRYDIASGDGVYRSTDGGATWAHAGLADTRAIGRIAVDPKDPDLVLAAALGHVFGPNAERGVFRSTDGGKSWTKTLFLDEDTGAVDLVLDPEDPKLAYAATWQARYYPWLSYFQPVSGPGSAVYKSTDEGQTWTKLAGGGWPAGDLGRIGLAVSGQRIYAAVDAAEASGNVPSLPGGSGGAGGLWRSDDAGATWTRVNADRSLGSSYFGHVFIDPRDPDTVYAMGQSIRRSTDGGRSFAFVKGAPGGDDYHFLWINPKRPDHLVTAADQGAVVTVNGGRTWSTWYNQPTAQVYHVETDEGFPYRIYGGQQDSGTISIASRSDYGQITLRNWHPVGGDERDYDIPDPGDPQVVYGSGLGGHVSRYDHRTGQVQEISPWPILTYGRRPVGLKYRYTWITPLAVSKKPPYALYLGAQVLFRSTDQGSHWETVSPDLSRAEKGAQGCDGAITLLNAGPCGFGVIYSIALSPRDPSEIWAGTDDGLIHVTRDGGKSWANVTPPAVKPWQKIASLEVSALDPGTAYAAVDAHRLDDFSPHAYRTRDHGRTWREITAGLPRDEYVSVLRVDPKARGLLFAGTANGVFVSLDDGESWESLQRNLPGAWVRDLAIHGDDLIAATQGRAIWVLDDIAPLREAREAARAGGPYLFAPVPAVRWRGNESRDTPLPPETPVGENPPAGAILDYFLPETSSGPVTLSIFDAKGRPVRRFSSEDTPETLAARQYFADLWLPRPAILSAAQGAHRFVWDLREPRPKAPSYEYSIAATPFAGTTAEPRGLMAPPGTYTVELAAAGAKVRRELRVVMDPRVTATPADLDAQKQLSDAIVGAMEADAAGSREVAEVLKQVSERRERAGDGADLRALLDQAANALASTAESFGSAAGELTDLETGLIAADRAPTAGQREVFAELEARSRKAAERWRQIRTSELPKSNQALLRAGLPALGAPGVGGAAFGGGSEDRP